MVGVILAGYGGPSSLDDVEPFLASIAGGRKFTPEQIEAVRARYRLIGGKSPLNEITVRQAEALQARLNGNGIRYTVRVGMLHLPPRIPDAAAGIITDGVRKIAVVTLAPFRSRASTAAYFNEAAKALQAYGDAEAVYVSGWNRNPNFIGAAAAGINGVIESFPEEERGDVDVIFSIHSVPESHIRDGDSYVGDINDTVEAIVPRLRGNRHHIAYQSKGRGEGWLGPDTETIMKKLSGEKRTRIVIAPIGFISDHVETLYDIDITLYKLARELGVTMKRVPALNDSPLFISALAEETKKATAHWFDGGLNK